MIDAFVNELASILDEHLSKMTPREQRKRLKALVAYLDSLEELRDGQNTKTEKEESHD